MRGDQRHAPTGRYSILIGHRVVKPQHAEVRGQPLMKQPDSVRGLDPMSTKELSTTCHMLRCAAHMYGIE